MDFVQSNTHGPEYSWHKYWSRKPANVIGSYLEHLVPKGGSIVDPFSGSGVVLREGTKLGFNVRAFDVNPSAVAISEFMLSKIDRSHFISQAHSILEQVEAELGSLYLLNGKEIRFVVHHIVTKCSKCGIEITYEKDAFSNTGKKCPSCLSRLSFGLSAMIKTVVKEIVFKDGSQSQSETDLLAQEKLSTESEQVNFTFDLPFVDNRRTLTSSDRSTKDLFTKRNFWILSRVAELAHLESNSDVRNALLLIVTGSSAQASRLIASRGKLAGGGQAWTIPGFWVPPIHLESNPFTHMRSRLKKMESALKVLQEDRSSHGEGMISQIRAQDGLRDLIQSNQLADLVFLDPPYGDSVSFMEFSTIWNSFLAKPFRYIDDISVSDRTQQRMTMESYKLLLEEVCQLVSEVLKPNGVVLLTFNNQDLDAWKSIVGALQKVGFRAIDVKYQDPAVISTKSQLAINGSYIGDFYVTFSRSDSPLTDFEDARELLAKILAGSAKSRGGTISKGLAYRFALQAWLVENIDANQINLLDVLLKELFESNGKTFGLLTDENEVIPLVNAVQEISARFNLTDSRELNKFSQALTTELRFLGSPSVKEALLMIPSDEEFDQLW
jgi:DNA modification methylase